MLVELRRNLARHLTEPVVRPLARMGLSPNVLTILGFLLSIAIAYLLATGRFFPGGLLVLFSGWFDLLDGALARASGRSVGRGRLSEAAWPSVRPGRRLGCSRRAFEPFRESARPEPPRRGLPRPLLVACAARGSTR